jgi:hypothetical protein
MPQFEPGMPVSITIGGTDYPIRFTLRVLKQLQQDHGISVISGNFGETFTDVSKLAVILFYGLRLGHPEMTLDWVEDNVDTSMLVSMIPALTFAMSGRQARTEAAPDTSPNAERPKVNGIGSPFGPSDASTSG